MEKGKQWRWNPGRLTCWHLLLCSGLYQEEHPPSPVWCSSAFLWLMQSSQSDQPGDHGTPFQKAVGTFVYLQARSPLDRTTSQYRPVGFRPITPITFSLTYCLENQDGSRLDLCTDRSLVTAHTMFRSTIPSSDYITCKLYSKDLMLFNENYDD